MVPVDEQHLRHAPVTRLEADGAAECAAVLTTAFAEDATLRYVIGDAGSAFAARLKSLIHFFVQARVLRDEPILGLHDGSKLAGAALVSYPWGDSPDALASLRSTLWSELGSAARERYEAIGRAAGRIDVGAHFLSLNMLGVLPSHRGFGIGRRLVAAVQELSRHEADSRGVALVAEGRVNARFYRNLGFTEAGRATVSPGLVVMVFVRADETD